MHSSPSLSLYRLPPAIVFVLPVLGLLALATSACSDNGPNAPTLGDAGPPIDDDGEFFCRGADSVACIGDVFWFCESTGGEFGLRRRSQDCRLDEQVCIEEPRVGCAVCRPGELGCFEGQRAECNDQGTGWNQIEACNAPGEACRAGRCENLCENALDERSYLGCEFYAVDLDNFFGTDGNAAAQQYAVVVSNPGQVATSVTIDRNIAPPGSEPVIETLFENVTISPGDLETFELPASEVDGSSSRRSCDPDAIDDCGPGEACNCEVNPIGDQFRCRCLVEGASGQACDQADDFGCPKGESCERQPDLTFRCEPQGFNDGPHTALTSRAYRISSELPVVAYQFNPLDNVGVFSNDASLLLPTSAAGDEYTVVGWPQTLSSVPSGDPPMSLEVSEDPCDDSLDCAPNDGLFCDPRDQVCRVGFSNGDRLVFITDARASLTLVGLEDDTTVQVELGPDVGRLVAGGPFGCAERPGAGCGQACLEKQDCALGFQCELSADGTGICDREVFLEDEFEITLDAYQVLNLETDVLNGDFTGTKITSVDGKPVSVFTGSEASDAPRFDTRLTRQCCADHLEEQLIPDRAVGDRYIISRMPPRSVALNRSFLTFDTVGEVDEPEYVRVLAVSPGTTTVETTLPNFSGTGFQRYQLDEGESVVITVPPDSVGGTAYVPGRFDGFILESDQPVSVLQTLPSQAAVGIPTEFPGGDPAILTVPPTDQYRSEYVFLTPDRYAFDFVVITGPADAVVLLDGEPLDSSNCTISAADGRLRDPMAEPPEPPPTEVIRRCQLSFPDVIGQGGGEFAEVEEGIQDDGVHRVVATAPVGVIVYGFDAFVSYAYPAGLDVTLLR